MKNHMNLDIWTIYETTRIRDYFKLKDSVEKDILSKVVYQFSCSGDSRVQYIGYTNRTLQERVKEHLGGKTAVSDHVGTCETCNGEGVSINNFDVLKKCRNWGDTSSVYEAIFIQRRNPILNRQLTNTTYHTFTLRVFD